MSVKSATYEGDVDGPILLLACCFLACHGRVGFASGEPQLERLRESEGDVVFEAYPQGRSPVSFAIRFVCLPDTIDPRQARGLGN